MPVYHVKVSNLCESIISSVGQLQLFCILWVEFINNNFRNFRMIHPDTRATKRTYCSHEPHCISNSDWEIEFAICWHLRARNYRYLCFWKKQQFLLFYKEKTNKYEYKGQLKSFSVQRMKSFNFTPNFGYSYQEKLWDSYHSIRYMQKE